MLFNLLALTELSFNVDLTILKPLSTLYLCHNFWSGLHDMKTADSNLMMFCWSSCRQFKVISQLTEEK